MDSIEQCIIERESHEQELQNGLKRLNEKSYRFKNTRFKKLKHRMLVPETKTAVGLYQTKGMIKHFWDDTDIKPSYDMELMVEVPYSAKYNVFAVDTKHSEQSECITNTCVVEKVDSNVIPNFLDMCDNDIQTDQNVEDERDALSNLIANLKLDIDENKMIQKQLKKANASLTQELQECKSTLAETSRTLWESNSIRDSCLIALQYKHEFERYKAFNDRTVSYDKLERELNETLGLLAQKRLT
nr:hypothetical protein [Tanacetum cinerariifolium]